MKLGAGQRRRRRGASSPRPLQKRERAQPLCCEGHELADLGPLPDDRGGNLHVVGIDDPALLRRHGGARPRPLLRRQLRGGGRHEPGTTAGPRSRPGRRRKGRASSRTWSTSSIRRAPRRSCSRCRNPRRARLCKRAIGWQLLSAIRDAARYVEEIVDESWTDGSMSRVVTRRTRFLGARDIESLGRVIDEPLRSIQQWAPSRHHGGADRPLLIQFDDDEARELRDHRLPALVHAAGGE